MTQRDVLYKNKYIRLNIFKYINIKTYMTIRIRMSETDTSTAGVSNIE